MIEERTKLISKIKIKSIVCIILFAMLFFVARFSLVPVIILTIYNGIYLNVKHPSISRVLVKGEKVSTGIGREQLNIYCDGCKAYLVACIYDLKDIEIKLAYSKDEFNVYVVPQYEKSDFFVLSSDHRFCGSFAHNVTAKEEENERIIFDFLTNDIMPHIATNDLYKKLYTVGINDFLCYAPKNKRDVVLQQIKYANNEFDSSFDSETKRELNTIAVELLEYNHYINYKK